MSNSDKQTYEFLLDQDIKAILLDQARQVETLLIQHNIFKPSKLQDSAAYMEWQNKETMIQNSLKSVKRAILESGYTKDDLLELLENSEKTV
tara:strand:+ start:505 stop:780 length:276 start_codon:yes stop_codon:yes gene_type:complete